jgi:DNA polymerase-3 subunit alpha (Gram-positive type)
MMTGVDPHTIPLDDKGVFSLFSSTEALCIRPDDIGGCDFGTLGLPEFENDFAMDIIQEAKPEKFSDLVRISLLQHGTNTWLKNAQDFTEDGDATLDTVISSRDDIMLDLMSYGIDRENAYEIMESVRKGHGLSAEMTENLQKQEVPEWYMESCDRIRYLFPKAHAAGYVMMAFRIAFFKLYYPLAFYAAYFTIRGSGFSYEKMCRGPEVLAGYIADCEKRIHGLTRRERAILHVMYLCREMYARGFKFMKLDLFRAKAHEFQVIEGMLMPSIDSIDRV